MTITERLANMPIWAVVLTIAILLVIRYVLLRQKLPMAKSIAEIAESLAVAMALVFLLIRPFVVQAFFIPSESMLPGLRISDHILVNKFVYRFREPKLGDVVVFKAPPEATPDGSDKDFIKRVIGVPGDVIRITPGYVMIDNVEYAHSDLRQMLAPNTTGFVKLVDGKAVVDGRLMTNEEIAAAIGKPNAKVKVFPGTVYINGKALKETYTAEDPDDPYPGGPRYTIERDWLTVDKKGEQAVKIPKGKLLVMGDNRNNSNDARYWGLLDRNRVLGKAMFMFWPVTRVGMVR